MHYISQMFEIFFKWKAFFCEKVVTFFLPQAFAETVVIEIVSLQLGIAKSADLCVMLTYIKPTRDNSLFF